MRVASSRLLPFVDLDQSIFRQRTVLEFFDSLARNFSTIDKQSTAGPLKQNPVVEPQILGAVSDDEWRGMCSALERPDWLDDERFCTPMGRVQNA